MFETRITKRFGLKAPIINAGMAFVAGPELAAAVANAGGLGMLGGAMVPADGLRMMIHATRSMTEKNFGVDLIGDFINDAHIDVLVEERVPLVVFFWSGPSKTQVQTLKAGGVAFWMQVGSVEEAKACVELGVEALIVQGCEAGGHNRSEASLAILFDAIKQALPGMPLIAAGGISDGATMAMALQRGADAVWCGTRFLASHEAEAHADYKARVVAAGAGDTAITTVFGPEWPGQPVRAIVNTAVRTADGRVKDALRDAVGQTIGKIVLGGETVAMPKYSAILPNRTFEGDLEWTCLTAGECCANISDVEPAGAIIATMMRQATDTVSQASAPAGHLSDVASKGLVGA